MEKQLLWVIIIFNASLVCYGTIVTRDPKSGR